MVDYKSLVLKALQAAPEHALDMESLIRAVDPNSSVKVESILAATSALTKSGQSKRYILGSMTWLSLPNADLPPGAILAPYRPRVPKSTNAAFVVQRKPAGGAGVTALLTFEYGASESVTFSIPDARQVYAQMHELFGK